MTHHHFVQSTNTKIFLQGILELEARLLRLRFLILRMLSLLSFENEGKSKKWYADSLRSLVKSLRISRRNSQI